MMIESLRFYNYFDVYDNAKNLDTDELKRLSRRGLMPWEMPGMRAEKRVYNIVMADWKQAAANAIFPNIYKLVITSQTSSPSDDEETWTGEIYETTQSDIFARSSNVLPYTVAWNIGQTSGNGNWGSFILATNNDVMINRALAGITKSSGSSKIVYFTGNVRSS